MLAGHHLGPERARVAARAAGRAPIHAGSPREGMLGEHQAATANGRASRGGTTGRCACNGRYRWCISTPPPASLLCPSCRVHEAGPGQRAHVPPR